MGDVAQVPPSGSRLERGVLALETYTKYSTTHERRCMHGDEESRENHRISFNDAFCYRLVMRTHIFSDVVTCVTYFFIVWGTGFYWSSCASSITSEYTA